MTTIRNPRVKKAVDRLGRLLAEVGMDPVRDQAVAGFHVDFSPDILPASSAFAAIEDTERFVFYLNLGVNVKPDRRGEVERFITRVNWDVMIGNFEMNHADGHVRFRTSLDFHGGELHEYLVRNAILAGMNAMETYAEALLDVAVVGHAADQALRLAERPGAKPCVQG